MTIEQDDDASANIDPDALIELAQSELGLVAPSLALCELCWAIQAHCSARGHAGAWNCIEVPMLLDALERGYSVQDLGELIRLWFELIEWMPALGLLQPQQAQAYAEQTRGWLLLRVRVGRMFASFLDRQDAVRSQASSGRCAVLAREVSKR